MVLSGRQDTVLRDAKKAGDPDLDLGTQRYLLGSHNLSEDLNLSEPKLFLDQSIRVGKPDPRLVLAPSPLHQEVIQIPA